MKSKRAFAFAIGSLLLHLACVALLSRAKFEPKNAIATTIELTIEAPPARSEPLATDTPPAAIQTIAPRPSEPSRPRRTRQSAPAPAPNSTPEPAEIVAITSPLPQPSAAAPAPVPQPLDLSARRAAASMLDTLELPPAACKPRASAQAGEATCGDPSERAGAAQATLDRALQTARTPAFLAKRDAPELHRQSDGSYRYDGHVFRATIRDDGHVDFADGPLATVDTVTPIGVGGRFDLNDAISAAQGAELYTAEKRWFLDQTAALREKLTAAARAAELARAKRELEAVLERIVTSPELAPVQKRERILALWEDCGDDAESAETRRMVVAFVRARMPEGSALSFTREELERWNRTRSAARRFEPYGS